MSSRSPPRWEARFYGARRIIGQAAPSRAKATDEEFKACKIVVRLAAKLVVGELGSSWRDHWSSTEVMQCVPAPAPVHPKRRVESSTSGEDQSAPSSEKSALELAIERSRARRSGMSMSSATKKKGDGNGPDWKQQAGGKKSSAADIAKNPQTQKRRNGQATLESQKGGEETPKAALVDDAGKRKNISAQAQKINGKKSASAALPEVARSPKASAALARQPDRKRNPAADIVEDAARPKGANDDRVWQQQASKKKPQGSATLRKDARTKDNRAPNWEENAMKRSRGEARMIVDPRKKPDSDPKWVENKIHNGKSPAPSSPAVIGSIADTLRSLEESRRSAIQIEQTADLQIRMTNQKRRLTFDFNIDMSAFDYLSITPIHEPEKGEPRRSLIGSIRQLFQPTPIAPHDPFHLSIDRESLAGRSFQKLPVDDYLPDGDPSITAIYIDRAVRRQWVLELYGEQARRSRRLTNRLARGAMQTVLSGLRHELQLRAAV